MNTASWVMHYISRVWLLNEWALLIITLIVVIRLIVIDMKMYDVISNRYHNYLHGQFTRFEMLNTSNYVLLQMINLQMPGFKFSFWIFIFFSKCFLKESVLIKVCCKHNSRYAARETIRMWLFLFYLIDNRCTER